MHPVLVHELVAERQAELRRQLGYCRALPPRGRRHYRQRAGWMLVEVGLRLAVEPSGAPVSPPSESAPRGR